MAEDRRMTAEEVVNDLLQTEHADVVRESVRWMVQQMMEVEVSGLIGAEYGERTEDRATHRNGYRPALRHARRRARDRDPEAPQGQLLPELPAAEKARRAGARGRRPGGLRGRGLHAQGRPGRRVARPQGLEVRGLAHLRRPRRAGRGLPPASARGSLPLPLPRRQGREGQRRRPRRAQVRGHRPTACTSPGAGR